MCLLQAEKEAALTGADRTRINWGRWLADTSLEIPADSFRAWQAETFQVTFKYLAPRPQAACRNPISPPPEMPQPFQQQPSQPQPQSTLSQQQLFQLFGQPVQVQPVPAAQSQPVIPQPGPSAIDVSTHIQNLL